MVELFGNSGFPDQTPRSAASDPGLHCLPVTRLGVYSLQWVKLMIHFQVRNSLKSRTLFQMGVLACCKSNRRSQKLSPLAEMARSLPSASTPLKIIIFLASEPPHGITNKMDVRPAKTQISLGIRPV